MDDAPTPPPRPRGSWWRRVSRLPVAMMLASLLAALGIVQLSFHLGLLAYRSVTWTQDTRAANVRIATLRGEIRMLEDAKRAAGDPAYLTELARCQGYVGGRERILVSPDAPSQPVENCDVKRLP